MWKDLNMPVGVVVCETTREADGLAMSSRNAYMAPEERAAAPVVYLSLQAGADARKRAADAGRRVLWSLAFALCCLLLLLILLLCCPLLFFLDYHRRESLM